VVTGRVIAGDADVADGFAPSVIEHGLPAEYSGRQWRDVGGIRGLVRERRQAAGHLVSAAGVVAGATEWIVSRPK